MNQDQYEYLLGTLARVDKKIDLLIEKKSAIPMYDDEFEEEFDI